MSRAIAALFLATAVATPAVAQPPAPAAQPVQPPPVLLPGGQPGIPSPIMGGSSTSLVIAKVEKDRLVTEEYSTVPVAKEVVAEAKTPDGQVIKIKTTVIVYETRAIKKSSPLSAVKATTATGKEVSAEKLAELLKEDTVVLLSYGPPLAEKLRKALKDDVLCLTLANQPGVGAINPGVVPPPPPPPPLPVPKS